MAAPSTPPSKRTRRLYAEDVAVLIDDATAFGVSERGLWHAVNVGASLPARLGVTRDNMTILSATTAARGEGGAPGPPRPLRLGAGTRTHFIYASYRVVIGLDASPSMFNLDGHGGGVLWKYAADALVALLRQLLVPLRCDPPTDALPSHQACGVGGGGSGELPPPPAVTFSPEILLSVVAVGRGRPQLLLHGASLSLESLDSVAATITSGMVAVEGVPPGTAPPSLRPLLEACTSVLKLLPSRGCPALLCVTDGVSPLFPPPGDAHYGSLLQQLSRHDTTVNVLQVGTCSGVCAGLGFVPDTEAMSFIATATGGFRVRSTELGVAPPADPPASGDPAHYPHGIPFTTSRWGKLQQQLFVRTAVLSVDEGRAHVRALPAPRSPTGPHASPLMPPPRAHPRVSALAHVSTPLLSAGAAGVGVGAGRPSPPALSLTSEVRAPPPTPPPPRSQLQRTRLLSLRLPGADPTVLLDSRLKEGYRVVTPSFSSSAPESKDTLLLLVYQPSVLLLYTLGRVTNGALSVTLDCVSSAEFAEQLAADPPAQPSRLTAGAAFPLVARGLRGFVTVVEQVDRVAAHLCVAGRAEGDGRPLPPPPPPPSRPRIGPWCSRSPPSPRCPWCHGTGGLTWSSWSWRPARPPRSRPHPATRACNERSPHCRGGRICSCHTRPNCTSGRGSPPHWATRTPPAHC